MAIEEEYTQAIRAKYSDNDQLRRAAENGDPEAQFFYGQLYNIGIGVHEDSEEAARWLKKAADQGESRALLELGNLYYVGFGVREDIREAVRLVNMSIKNGNKSALGFLDMMSCRVIDSFVSNFEFDFEAEHIIYADQLSRYARKNFYRFMSNFATQSIIMRGCVKGLDMKGDSVFVRMETKGFPWVDCICVTDDPMLLDVDAGRYITVRGLISENSLSNHIFLLAMIEQV